MQDDKHDKYQEAGMLGSYRTSATPFPNPEGIHVFEGYGANESDLQKGFISPAISNNPAYDKSNYVDKWSKPMRPDDDFSDFGMVKADVEFREKDLESKGFLTRPRIPTER